MQPPVRVSFVCSGNICRSPTAEIVLRSLARDSNLAALVQVDSSGTGSWHRGDDMDERSRQTLVDAGYSPGRHEAKQFDAGDFVTRDVIVALDTGHRDVLWWLAADAEDVNAARAKIVMLRDFDPELGAGEKPDVADPYYGGTGGFGKVLAQVERSCAALLAAIARGVESGGGLQQTDKPLL
ncbi:MAG: low molecular weight protein-tyrosine-phosphatase [Jatrophihabitans sp.]